LDEVIKDELLKVIFKHKDWQCGMNCSECKLDKNVTNHRITICEILTDLEITIQS